MPTPDLTAKQEMFCKEYLVDLNATQACIRAGYSKKTARSLGCENLTKPYIQQEIQRVSKEIEREQRVSLAHHVTRMQDLSQKAEDAGQYGSAIQAEHYAGKVSRLYVDQAHVISEKRESPEVIIERLNKLIES